MRSFACALALGATLGGCGDARQAGDTATARNESLVYRNVERGFAVAHPKTWILATRRLTPNLADPKELVAVATFDSPPGGDRCSHMPVAAVEAMGPNDALIVVFERQPPWPASGYPPRSELDVVLEANTNRFCVPAEGRLDAWTTFSDAGRAFYLLAAVGPEASARTRAELRRIVASLQFEERRAADD